MIPILTLTEHQELGVIRLACDTRAPYRAREAVTAWVGPAHPSGEILVLAASELVTNAVLHGGDDDIEVTLSQGPDFLRLVVTDPGAARSTPVPVPRQASTLYAEHGRGLAIVRALSRDRWGSYRLPASGRRAVWCDLDLHPTPAQLDELFHGSA
ncbi:ATP-binding protein [Nonomuraea sp. NPDC004297]